MKTLLCHSERSEESDSVWKYQILRFAQNDKGAFFSSWYFLILLFLLFVEPAQAQESPVIPPILRDRYGCVSLPLSDSVKRYWEGKLIHYQDTVLLYQEDRKDTALIFHKKGRRTELIAFVADKKIDGYSYEIKGWRRLPVLSSDTIKVFDFFFGARLDTITRYRGFPLGELDPILRFGLHYGKQWLCYTLPRTIRYDYIYDPRSMMAARLDVYYKLWEGVEVKKK